MVSLIIPAAGNGSRLRLGNLPKALTPFSRGTLLSFILNKLEDVFERVVIVVKPDTRVVFLESLRESVSLMCLEKIEFVLQESPSGSLDAVLLGLSEAQGDSAVVLWCDQVGVSRRTVCRVIKKLSDYDLVVPYVDLPHPYVWLECDGGLVVAVGRMRDGDSVPGRGRADLGLFGLGKGQIQRLLEARNALLESIGERELDFTYVIPILSNSVRSVLLESVNPTEALGVNTPDDLEVARRALAP